MKSSIRFKFKKFHIDKTWKEKFSADALDYLSQSKEWLYEKLNLSFNDEKMRELGSDWIIIIDSGDIDQMEDPNSVKVRTLLVSTDHDWYNGFDNMFFKFGDLKRGAVMNLQSEHFALKEVAIAVIKGARAKFDDTIKFPYTVGTWREKADGGQACL